MPFLNTVLIDGGGDSTYDFSGFIRVYQNSATSISVDADEIAIIGTPDSYELTYQRLLSNGANDGSPTTVTSTTLPISISGLIENRKYRLSLKAIGPTTSGNPIVNVVELSSTSFNSQIVGSSYNPFELAVAKSYLTITNNEKDKRKYAVAYREFDSLTMPTSTNITIEGEGSKTKSAKSYSKKYYSFGTTFLIAPTKDNIRAGAGLGFFVGPEASSGYFILIDTTATSATLGTKPVTIGKLDGIGSGLIKLKTSQINPASTLDAIYAGVTYSIDVKVMVDGPEVKIQAFINGFKITATDTTKYTADAKFNRVIDPTDRIGLVVRGGSVAFDYAYATDITEAQYNDATYVSNFYQGQFSNDFLNTAYGDLIYNAEYADEEQEKIKTSVDEFGTVVREITKVKTKFDSRPAYPLKWSVGDNKFASIIGSKISHFGGEAYVLNNSSTTIPLADGSGTSFYVYGNHISLSGVNEYTTDESDDFENPEPVIFQSKWIQNIADVESLANWIKNNSINRGKVIDLEIFGNPLISVGDVISIKYLYNGLSGTEKFIVTKVNHSFGEGLTTTIKCRSL